MPLTQIKQLLEEHKDNQEVMNYLRGLIMTPEGVNAFLDTEAGRKLLQPRLDQHFTKGLETWKEKTLPTMLEEEIKKRFPGETEEQKLLKKLQADLEAEKQARLREALRNKAITTATEKGLPVSLIDHFLGQDEEATLANIEKFQSVFQEHLEKAVAEKFKDNGRSPNTGGGAPKTTLEQLQEQLKTATRLDERIAIRNKIFELQQQKKE